MNDVKVIVNAPKKVQIKSVFPKKYETKKKISFNFSKLKAQKINKTNKIKNIQ